MKILRWAKSERGRDFLISSTDGYSRNDGSNVVRSVGKEGGTFTDGRPTVALLTTMTSSVL